MTEKIIGCAYHVYNTMGFAFLECIYEKFLMIKLPKIGIEAKSQKAIAVRYDEEAVGEFIADIVVEDTIIIELKSARRIAVSHEVQ